MTRSKRSKASKGENDLDFISNMPDPILELILQGLPTTEEVVRTSILSTRWRYLWTSIPFFPSLNFDRARLLNSSLVFPEKEYQEFVSWALANKTVDLDSFHLGCSSYYTMPTVDSWIYTAVTRKVKSLHLLYSESTAEYLDFKLPQCLTTCDSLEVLRVFTFGSPLFVYRRVGFPTLRVLELNSVSLYGEESVHKFLGSCPLLEDLSLIDCSISDLKYLCIACKRLKTLTIDNRGMIKHERNEDGGGANTNLYFDRGLCRCLKIVCPKLVYLEYAGHIADEFIFKELDSLKKAVIYPKNIWKKLVNQSMGDTMRELFYGVSHVESLSLNFHFIQAIHAALDLSGNLLKYLPSLKTLELTISIDAFTMDILIRILRGSPDLESLNLIIQEEFKGTDYWDLDKVKTRRILTRHLKRVEFLEYNGERQKLHIAHLLLEHGHALEEMVFSWCDKDRYHEKSVETMNEVSKFRKASSNVKLVTLVKDR